MKKSVTDKTKRELLLRILEDRMTVEIGEISGDYFVRLDLGDFISSEGGHSPDSVRVPHFESEQES